MNPSMRLHKFLIPVLLAGAIPAHAALTFNPTFTSAFTTDFGANALQAEAAFNAATAIFSNAFTDPITININVTAVTGTGTLGMSSTPIFSIGWGTLEADVAADAKSAADFAATGLGGSITGPDPSTDTWFLTRSQEKALGIIASDAFNDGTITVGTGFTYDYNDADGVTAGEIDLTDVFAHEISEVMGRIGLSGELVGGVPALSLLDAFSFTGAGARGLGGGAGNQFSIDDGTTLLKLFNNATANGGDTRDWAGGTNDSFNAFSSSGVLNPVTAIDLEELDVLGYDSAVPEPATVTMVGLALLAGAVIGRRRQKRA
jgi:PEP-CTERM motif-containing protein